MGKHSFDFPLPLWSKQLGLGSCRKQSAGGYASRTREKCHVSLLLSPSDSRDLQEPFRKSRVIGYGPIYLETNFRARPFSRVVYKVTSLKEADCFWLAVCFLTREARIESWFGFKFSANALPPGYSAAWLSSRINVRGISQYFPWVQEERGESGDHAQFNANSTAGSLVTQSFWSGLTLCIALSVNPSVWGYELGISSRVPISPCNRSQNMIVRYLSRSHKGKL